MYMDTQSGFYDRLDLEGEQKNQRWLQDSPLTELLFFIEYLGLPWITSICKLYNISNINYE